MIPRETEAKDRLARAASAVTAEKDLSEWVEANKTGSSPPVPPTYVPKVCIQFYYCFTC